MIKSKKTYHDQNKVEYKALWCAVFYKSASFKDQYQSVQISCTRQYVKVQILWEGNKIWNNIPLSFEIMYLATSKQGKRFFQTFVAFSEYLNFKIMSFSTAQEMHIYQWNLR